MKILLREFQVGGTILRLRSEAALRILAGHALELLLRVFVIALRRLQHAAERRDVLAMLFRASRAPSCMQATLRLHISRQDGNTAVRILKRRGGGIPAPIVLDLHNRLLRRPGAAQHPAFEPVSETYAASLATH